MSISMKQALAGYEYQLISYALQVHEGRVDQAARVLSVTRAHLIKRCRALGIKRTAAAAGEFPSYQDTVWQMREKLIRDALWIAKGHVKTASDELLRANRASIFRHMHRLDIDPDDYRPARRQTGLTKARKQAQKTAAARAKKAKSGKPGSKKKRARKGIPSQRQTKKGAPAQ